VSVLCRPGQGAVDVRACSTRHPHREAHLNTYFEDAEVLEDPNVELLAGDGWEVLSSNGPYYTVWRDGEEMLLVWRDGRWRRLGGGGFDNS